MGESNQANKNIDVRGQLMANHIRLGLAIVKRYTEMMGGRVWCESEPGMGAAFNLEFEEVI